jgi:hypothetical protein
MAEFGTILAPRDGKRRQLMADRLEIPDKRTVRSIYRIAEAVLSKYRSCLDTLAMIGGKS